MSYGGSFQQSYALFQHPQALLCPSPSSSSLPVPVSSSKSPTLICLSQGLQHPHKVCPGTGTGGQALNSQGHTEGNSQVSRENMRMRWSQSLQDGLCREGLTQHPCLEPRQTPFPATPAIPSSSFGCFVWVSPLLFF